MSNVETTRPALEYPILQKRVVLAIDVRTTGNNNLFCLEVAEALEQHAKFIRDSKGFIDSMGKQKLSNGEILWDGSSPAVAVDAKAPG